MVLCLVEATGSVALENRTAKRLPLRHNAACNDARSAQIRTSQCSAYRTAPLRALKPFALRVVQHLAEHRLGVPLTMQFEENLLHQRHLILVENLTDAPLGDAPVVVDLLAQRMVVWPGDLLFLLVVQAAVKLGD